MYSVKDKCSVTTDNFFRQYKATILDNNQQSELNKNRIPSAISYNPMLTINSNQSPKIYSGKLRENFDKKTGYSLIDVNQDKICKGPSFPFNYIRDMALKSNGTFYNPKTKLSRNGTSENFYRKEEQKNKENENSKEEKIEEIKNNSRIHDNNLNGKENKNNDLDNDIIEKSNNLNKFHNIINEKNKLLAETNKIKRINTAGDYKYRSTEININEIKNEKNNFILQSKCGKEYERLIKISHEIKRLGGEFIPNPKIINQKMLESDIFFFSDKENEKANLFKSTEKIKTKSEVFPLFKKQDYLDSDVFLQKNNEKSQKKIGEKYLLKNNKYSNIGYHPSNKSNSGWSPKNYVKSYLNYNSCEYDIINPFVKKNVNTKSSILGEANGINPAKRQKGISEFKDLSRTGVPNINKEFVGAINKNERIFSKKEDLCQNFLELHKQYDNICDKPFLKKVL